MHPATVEKQLDMLVLLPEYDLVRAQIFSDDAFQDGLVVVAENFKFAKID